MRDGGRLQAGELGGAQAGGQQLRLHAQQQNDHEEGGEADGHQQQRQEHGGIDRGPAHADDAGGLVQRVPPVDRELDDGHVDEAGERQDGGTARAARGIVEGAQQRHMAEIEEEQDQHRGETGVPHPPGAPHRLAPERTAGQGQKGETGADGRGCARRHVGKRVAPDERGGAGSGDEAVDEQRHPGGGHMDVHDAHGLALLVVGRRVEQREVEAQGEQERGRHGEPGQHGVGDALEARRVGEAMHDPRIMVAGAPCAKLRGKLHCRRSGNTRNSWGDRPVAPTIRTPRRRAPR
jgi:hypothetical protein